MDALRKHRPHERALTAIYDRPVDVLVVTFGEHAPMEGEGRPRGIELDYLLTNGAPCAVKVIGFHRNYWDHNIEELASLIAEHLSFDPIDITSAIKTAMAKRR